MNSEKFIRALENGDINAIRQVPKADVHNHAALGGDFSRWKAAEGLDLEAGGHHFPDFTDFQNLVNTIFTYPHRNPTKEQTRRRLLSLYRATFETAIADGVTYIEPGFDSPRLDTYDGDIEAMLADLQSVTSEYADRLLIRPDIGIIRVLDRKTIERTIIPCIDSGFFAALDIFADERSGPPEEFVDIFQRAKTKGMKLKAHAGELLDAEFVRRSVERLDLDEVQHGIAAANSPEVMRFLAQRGTRLNICPSSNIQLCQTESFNTHPLRILIDNGVKTTINSDDIIIFGRTVSQEFLSLYETGLYSAAELDTVRLNGFC